MSPTCPTPRRGDDDQSATVFYDGGCPLCRREIAHYRRLDRQGELRWVDISREPEVLRDHGLAVETAMARLHVLGGDGRWHTGAKGFAHLWSRLPGYRWLSRFVATARLLPLLERGYSRFARWRLRRRSGETPGAPPGGHE
jgi:predicted DCC family thiol-disulfide oxidoreductase YuxK